MRTLFRCLLPSTLLAFLILPGCGDQAADQAGEPLEMPAMPEQIEKLDAVIERFPEVKPLAEQARADGTVTEQEIIDVFAEAEKLKNARERD